MSLRNAHEKHEKLWHQHLILTFNINPCINPCIDHKLTIKQVNCPYCSYIASTENDILIHKNNCLNFNNIMMKMGHNYDSKPVYT